MQVNQFVVSLNSEDPERLIAFYRDTIGLSAADDVAPGAFRAGSGSFIALIIEGHSEVVGATKEPQRVLFNFLVEDVVAEQARLEAAGVDFVVPLHEEPGFGLISTFVDPDGNYGQLLEMRG